MHHKALTRDLFVAYAKAGISYNEIGPLLKIGRSTVFRWRKDLKLEARVRGKGAPCVKEERKGNGG